MYQLELDLFPYRSKIISEGGNQILYLVWKHLKITEDQHKISYHESVYVKNQKMDLEDWIHIKRKDSGKLTLEYFYSFLKKIKDNKLDVLKEFLTHRKIVFEKSSWESFE